jgi:predicted deacylase
MRPRRTQSSTLVFLIWGLNAFGVLVLLGIFLLYWAGKSAQAAPQNILAASPTPTLSLPPTRYNLPTVTPNPLSTEIVVESPTPFVLPNGIRPGLIGSSVSGRPIEVYTFGYGGRQVMIVAGIHGGYEWNTIALADQLILYLNEHPETIPEDVTLFILRNLNPDGDARDHGIDGRANDHGVDLNRNFPVNWSATWNREGCYDKSPTTSGTGPGSEPETAAVINFLSYRRLTALISYHSAALGIFPGGEPWDETSIRLARQIAEVSNYPFPPIKTGCVYTGTLADFAVSHGIAAVDLELSNHKQTEFNTNLQILKILLNFGK